MTLRATRNGVGFVAQYERLADDEESGAVTQNPGTKWTVGSSDTKIANRIGVTPSSSAGLHGRARAWVRTFGASLSRC